jgi:hypothetical protein
MTPRLPLVAAALVEALAAIRAAAGALIPTPAATARADSRRPVVAPATRIRPTASAGSPILAPPTSILTVTSRRAAVLTPAALILALARLWSPVFAPAAGPGPVLSIADTWAARRPVFRVDLRRPRQHRGSITNRRSGRRFVDVARVHPVPALAAFLPRMRDETSRAVAAGRTPFGSPQRGSSARTSGRGMRA